MNKNATWALTATFCALAAAECKIPGRETNEQILAESSQPQALTLYRDRLAIFAAYCNSLGTYASNDWSTDVPNPPEGDNWGPEKWKTELQLGARVDRENLLIATVDSLRRELGGVGFELNGTLRCYVQGGSVSNHLRVKKKK